VLSGVESAELREEFKRIAKLYQVSDDPDLCVLALRLAFAPETIKFDKTDDAVSAWTRLASVPVLARGAFFARLVADIAIREYYAGTGRST